MINTFTEAVQTVDAAQAVGKPHLLWVNFAQFYEENKQIAEVSATPLATPPVWGSAEQMRPPRPQARVIFEKATKVDFRNVDDLAALWCEWAEMELRHE